MKQLILVGNQKVKFQDTETIISLTLVSDGNTVTIDSTKTYSVKIKNGTGYVKAINATPDTTNNMVTFSTSGFDGLPVDAYFLELWVIDTNGQTIYPSDSFIELDITANATGVQGQVVPAITLQEFEDRFSTLQSDLEAKVGTLIGPTGATGNGISGVSTQYQLGTDGVNVPTGTWRDTPSTPTDTLPYMWTRNVTTYTDKSTHTSYNISAKGTKGNNFTIQGSTSSIAGLPSIGTDGEGYMVGTELYVWTNGKWNDIVNMKGVQGDQGIQGIQGVKGDTGTGIQSTSTDYELSSQGVEVPNTGWSTTIPVTTNDLPYLWTRVTITFTDSSQHVIYFTSNKGDKGDKGDTGEKGDTGANLAVKGAVDKATSLPSTGNSEGDAYLVGTDLYVYTKGAWKDCGPIVAENTVLYNTDGSLNVNGTNYTYVQDLRNGKIQYNDGTKNVQVTPMDADKEASDILAARTYTDTSVSALSTNVDTKLSTKANAADLSTGLATKVTDNKDGTEQLNGTKVQPFNKLSDTIGGRNLLIGTATPASITGNNSVNQGANTYALVGGMSAYTLYQKYGSTFTLSYDWSVTDTASAYTGSMQQQFSNAPWGIGAVVTISSNNTSGHVIKTFSLANNSANVATGFQFRLDNVPTTSTITVSNMKLEKGSIATDWTPAPEDKQDKIGYTPADDSKVLHSTVTQLNSTDMNTVLTAGFYNLDSGTNGMPNADAWTIYQVIPLSAFNGVQLAYGTNNAVLGMRSWHNGKFFSNWVKFADDSKVAHLSGANNFDTTPTVNNTPLLTSDKLPDNIVKQGDAIGNINYVMYLASYPTTVGQLVVADGTVDSTKTKFITTTNSYPVPTNVTSMIWETPKINMPLLVGNVIAFYDSSGNFISANAYDATTPYQLINFPKNAYSFKLSCGSNSLNSVKLFSGSSYIDSSPYPIVMGVRIKDKMAATVDDVSAATANMADTTKLSNFTAGLQSNGVAVATQTDLSTGLATKADTSAIDPSVLVKKTLTATDDVLALDPGTYLVWGTAPKNYPTKLPWGRVTVKMLGPDGVSADTKSVEVFDTSNNHWINIHAGYPLVWSGWEVPNSGTMASKSDVTTAISTATANSADVSKANTFSKQQTFSTNPTNGTQVYPIYATVNTDADATTLIASLQSSGFSGMVGVPES